MALGLSEISSAIGEISKGNFKTRINIDAIDNEMIKELANNINDAFGKLEERVEILEANARELGPGLSDTLDTISAIGSGDLTIRADENVQNLILSQLAASINEMVKGFSDIVVGVRNTSIALAEDSGTLLAHAEQTSNMAQQIAKTIQEMAKSSQDQSKQVEEARKIITEMSASIQQMASSVQNTSELAANVNKMAQEGGQSAEKGITLLH